MIPETFDFRMRSRDQMLLRGVRWRRDSFAGWGPSDPDRVAGELAQRCDGDGNRGGITVESRTVSQPGRVLTGIDVCRETPFGDYRGSLSSCRSRL
jgi:hypothetical protein